MSVIRALLTVVGLAAAWTILSPSLDVRATSGTPTLPAATAAEPGECRWRVRTSKPRCVPAWVKSYYRPAQGRDGRYAPTCGTRVAR